MDDMEMDDMDFHSKSEKLLNMLEKGAIACLNFVQSGGYSFSSRWPIALESFSFLMWQRVAEASNGFAMVMSCRGFSLGWSISRIAFEHFLIQKKLDEIKDSENELSRFADLLELQGTTYQERLDGILKKYQELSVFMKEDHDERVQRCEKRSKELKETLGFNRKRVVDTKDLLNEEIPEFCKKNGLLNTWFVIQNNSNWHMHPDVRQWNVQFTRNEKDEIQLQEPSDDVIFQLSHLCLGILGDSTVLANSICPKVSESREIKQHFEEVDNWINDWQGLGS
ncbi:MAG: hypothetical protein DWQ01_03660 [Planctomycetota bacterium]|nr:MAG: hypothetical protein DWQ01_03660 [Planctomycetota bacterium]